VLTGKKFNPIEIRFPVVDTNFTGQAPVKSAALSFGIEQGRPQYDFPNLRDKLGKRNHPCGRIELIGFDLCSLGIELLIVD
jgi:hypothetical protein